MEVIKEGDTVRRLAADADRALTPPPAVDRVEGDQDDAQGQAMAAQLEATAVRVLFGLLRAVRAKIARTNPYILEEWPDELLQEPAEAVVPVLKKHVGFLLGALGNYPEESALLLSLLPLALGWSNAQERAEKAKPAAAAAAAPGIPPAPTPPPTPAPPSATLVS